MSLTLASHSERSTASKKWDTELVAYLGALPGTAFGCVYEINEAISHDLNDIESFAQILGEITAAALASAALFAAAADLETAKLEFR